MDHMGEQPRFPEIDPSEAKLTDKDPVEAILEVLRQGERFLVCSHSRPDGDAAEEIVNSAAPQIIDELGRKKPRGRFGKRKRRG